MKIELKHLAPYLPYGLKGKEFAESEKMYELTIIQTNAKYKFIWNLVDNHLANSRIDCKPILRPLSDLNTFKPKSLLGRTTFEWSYYETKEHLITSIKTQKVNHNIWQFLLEHHFDVFGLIEKGLAIDINKINEQDSNAQLIASAPDLLKALIDLVEQIENEHCSEYIDDLQDNAKKAIEKAIK